MNETSEVASARLRLAPAGARQGRLTTRSAVDEDASSLLKPSTRCLGCKASAPQSGPDDGVHLSCPRARLTRRAQKVAETWGRKATAPEIALRGRCKGAGSRFRDPA